jgi:hypothetical protein
MDDRLRKLEGEQRLTLSVNAEGMLRDSQGDGVKTRSTMADLSSTIGSGLERGWASQALRLRSSLGQALECWIRNDRRASTEMGMLSYLPMTESTIMLNTGSVRSRHR